MLGLLRDDLDLDAGTAIVRAEDNKGKREGLVKFHPVVVEHLRWIAHFDPHVFPWPHDRTKVLFTEFARIQEAAGNHLACRGQHDHIRFCHVYGFYDLRRAFASMHANRLSTEALQLLMRHKSYETTRRYINLARQTDEVVAQLACAGILAIGRGSVTH